MKMQLWVIERLIGRRRWILDVKRTRLEARKALAYRKRCREYAVYRLRKYVPA